MADSTSGDWTVTIDETVHGTYKLLTEGSDIISVPFRTMKDVFMWAALLGFRQGKREPLIGKRVTIFRWSQFATNTDIPLLKAIALSEARDVNLLVNPDGVLTSVEEYANAGIHELRARILDEYGQPLWNLVGVLTNPID